MRHIEYQPGRFAAIAAASFAREAWSFLSGKEQRALLLRAAEEGRPPITPVLEELERRFAEALASPDYPPEEVGVMFNNMVKQLMEAEGWEHTACGLLPQARFIKVSGVYRKAGR